MLGLLLPMLKTGDAWEEGFGDEGASDEGTGNGYMFSKGTGDMLNGRWAWNEGMGAYALGPKERKQ